MLPRSSGAAFVRVTRFSHDDQPGTTEVFLEEGAAGKTAVDAVLVMDGISDAKVSVGFVLSRREMK